MSQKKYKIKKLQTDHMATKLSKSEQRQIRSNRPCSELNFGANTDHKIKNWKKKKEIKLLITWTLIHSQYQWAFCIQLSISKTTSVRNELDWCKNTDLLQSKVFTTLFVHLVTVYQTKCLGQKNKKPNSQRGEKGAALSPLM